MDAEIQAELQKLRNQIDSLKKQVEDLTQQVQAAYATKEYVSIYVDHMLAHLNTIHDPFTEDSTIAGYEPIDVERVLKHFQQAQQSYTLGDWRTILLEYDKEAKFANINPYLVIAQMVKETDWGRSWWAQRPRRNPAGLGVTGEVSFNPPIDRNGWAEDTRTHVWRKGNTFPSWEVSAAAHTGHLLAYLYDDNELNDAQRLLVLQDPRAKFVDRGSIKRLRDLDGKWAVPGVGYGRSIATLANALKQ